VGFGLRDIGRVGVGMDGAKLVQRGPVQERCRRSLTVQLLTNLPYCILRMLSHLMLIAVSWKDV